MGTTAVHRSWRTWIAGVSAQGVAGRRGKDDLESMGGGMASFESLQ